jgi:hypothetical protein
MQWDFTDCSFALLIEHFCEVQKEVCVEHKVYPAELTSAAEAKSPRIAEARSQFFVRLIETVGVRRVAGAKHVQIADERGVLPEGHQPISRPELARLFGCNQSTPTNAIKRVYDKRREERERARAEAFPEDGKNAQCVNISTLDN